MTKAWGGRFRDATDRRVEEFTESISFDRRLFAQDIAGSMAHAEMLAETGLLSKEERDRIVETLRQIGSEIEAGRFEFRTELEDIHMHIESALIERLGDVGRKLHTARSRNDQVATDLRLWTRAALDRIDERLVDLQKAFVLRAEADRELIMPGYTHLQRAQPILASHYALAYVEKFQRDRTRLSDCRHRLNVLPLGAAALAGTSLPIDRRYVCHALGFVDVMANSIDAVSDRDFVLETVFVLVLIAEHLSTWAEEWILWSSSEFHFIELPDAYCTGSSIMPQKKNPDVLELIRGKTARVIGSLQTLLVLLKGLPLAYNRDLQEDKPPLFDAVDTVSASLELAAALVAGARFRGAAIAARLEDGFLDATTLMEHLILRGIPQRSAHEIVGRLVRQCEERSCRLADLSLVDFRAADPAIGPEVAGVLGVARSVAAFQSDGSTARSEVERQLAAWRERLETIAPGA